MRIRDKLIMASMAGAAWLVIWALLGAGIAVGVEGTPDTAFGVKVILYGCASGILFGMLVFLAWWRGLPLWLRGTLYGLAAALPILLGIVAVCGLKNWTLDWYYPTAAALLSGLQGYLLRVVLVDVAPTAIASSTESPEMLDGSTDAQARGGPTNSTPK